MPKKSKSEKIAIVNNLVKSSQEYSSAAFVDFRGLKTKDMNELRKSVKASDGRIEVIKKTLALRGLGKMIVPEALTHDASVAVVWFRGDDVQSAFKAVWQFSKRHESLRILGGYADSFGGAIQAEEVIALAKLPSREILLGQLMTMLNWPMSGLVRVLAEIGKTRK